MENNILDEIEKEKEIPKFALKSYDQFWYSIICYTIVPIIYESLTRSNLVSIDFLSSWAGLIFPLSLILGAVGLVFNFLGTFYTIKSINEKEIFTWKIIVGGLGNAVLIFFLALFIIIQGYMWINK